MGQESDNSIQLPIYWQTQQPNSVNLVFTHSSGIQGCLTGAKKVVAFTAYLALIPPCILLSTEY